MAGDINRDECWNQAAEALRYAAGAADTPEVTDSKTRLAHAWMALGDRT